MKYLLPLLILIFAFTAFGYNQTSVNNWLTIGEFSIEDAKVYLGNIEYNQVDECTLTISPDNIQVGPFTYNTEYSFNVQAPIGCVWQAKSNDSWITLTAPYPLLPGKGVGNGTVTYKIAETYGNPRTGTISIGNQIFTVNQSSGCSYRIAYHTQSITVYGGGGEFEVRSSPYGVWQCSLTYSTNVPWIHVSSYSYSVDLNLTGQGREGQITFATGNGQVLTLQVIQPGGCPYIFSPTSQNIPATGGTGTFTVTTATGCVWSATPSQSWIAIVGSNSATGNGSVSFSVNANAGQSRSGYILVGDRTFNISQAGTPPPVCSFNISPTNQSIPSSESSGGFTITASDATCTWTATKSASWIFINTAGGTGNGSVSFIAERNFGAARTATITAGGQIFTINQASGCSYNLTSTSLNTTGSGGSGSFAISTSAGCSWTAVSNVPWITIITSGSTGSGSGTVNFTVQANTGAARSGTITAGGQTFTVNQAAVECSYSLSSTSTSVGSGGITRSVNVITQPGCSWTVVSNVSWITITSGSSGTGNGTVNFSVAANTGDARTGTITIAGQTFTISQTSGNSCTITVPSETLNFPSQGGNGTFAVTTNSGCNWTATTNASWITINTPSGTGNGTVSFTVSAFTTSGGTRTGTINVGGQSFIIEQDGELQPLARRTPFDFDGDGKADFSIYRPSVGEWWYLRSSDGGNAAAQFGTSTDKIVPADYTGDGKTDFAFYRPEQGWWYILRNEDFSYYAFPFGIAEDIPVPADYDGDGKTDPAVFRPSTQVWYVLRSTGGHIISWQFGSNGDIPVVADYNGDSLADIAVYTPSLGKWQIQVTTVGETSFQFGTSTDKPVPADYDGDGRTNAAYYRPSTNEWFILRSNGTTLVTQFGTSGDIPAPADYDGDGKTDIAIYRPSTSTWWYAASSANGEQRAREFGISTDIPVPSAYVR